MSVPMSGLEGLANPPREVADVFQKSPARAGDWMQTYTGAQFYPLAPASSPIRIDDIAAALSKLCRYGGHCIRFYSVAEHCVHVASAAPDDLKLAALLHDASEAYAVDIPRPLKASLPDYRAVERRIERAVAARFGLPDPLPAAVKNLDERIIVDEREQNMTPADLPWRHSRATFEPLGVTLRFWSPQEAAYQFLAAFYRYGGAR